MCHSCIPSFFFTETAPAEISTLSLHDALPILMEYLSDRIAVMYLGRLMEVGSSEDLCRNPKHPYTEALLSAVPDPDPSRRGKRVILAGDIPSPVNPPSGCVFRTRCPYAKPECAKVVPPLRAIAPD